MIVKFTPDHNSFGCNNLKSFINNLSYYQSVEQILHNNIPLDFRITNDPTESSILVVDVFEIYKNKNIKFHDTNLIVVETLRQIIDLLDIGYLDLSKKYIVFSESYWDEREYQWPGFNYSFVYISWEINDVRNRLANSANLYHYLLDINAPEKYNPEYDFLCLAGRGKPWRDAFINALKSKVNLSNSLTSYFGTSLGHSDLLALDIPYSRVKENFEDEFYSPLQKGKHPYVLSYFTKPELFYKTKFSVVVETEAEYNEYHITEKTLKCLVMGHPFVVMGTPGYLKFLRSLGFMTCEHLFNEDYDKISDLKTRINAVVDLVKDLQINYTFNPKDLIAMQSHNLRNLFQLKDINTYKQFLELFNERNSNKNI